MSSGANSAEELTETQLQYLAWRTDPDRTGGKAGFAKAHSVSESTLHNWDKSPRFQLAYEERLRELNLSPDKIQAVIAAAHKKATGGDVHAMKLYLDYLERLQPTRVTRPKGAEDLTDEELADLVAGVAELAE